jgi:uncharacterized OsmC-like protein
MDESQAHDGPTGSLDEYLVEKRKAIKVKLEAIRATGQAAKLSAKARVLGRSGIREIRIREFQVLNDSPPDFAGYDIAPTSPELLLGVLGSCLVHTTLIKAAENNISLVDVSVEVSGEMHLLAQQDGFEDRPIYPHSIAYKLSIVTKESRSVIESLHAAVAKACPIRALVEKTQSIACELDIRQPSKVAV